VADGHGTVDTRQKNKTWRCADGSGSISYEQAQLATLMDIRDELQGVRRELERMNGILHCSNTLQIPKLLRDIRKNTTKKPRAKKVAAPSGGDRR
jgi:hypothetical protein